MSFIDDIVFAGVFVVALGSSIAMLFARNAVHVALFLVATQLALAVAFVLEGAFFIAAIQVIVYAGAIMVLFLFVIMLLGVDRRESLTEPLTGQRFMAATLGAVFVGEILYVAWRGADLVVSSGGAEELTRLNRDPGNVTAVARLLFSDYLLPFEVTSVLLVVAAVGVMVLARRLHGIAQVSVPGEQAPEDRAA